MKRQLHCILQHSRKATLLMAVALILGSVVASATEYRYSDSWGTHGLSMKNRSTDGLSLNFSMQYFAMENREVNGEMMTSLSFSESLLPNEEGMPDLHGYGRYIAIPQGATPVLEIVSMRTETFNDIEIAPAPRIPLDTDKGPLHYAKDPQAYSTNAFYPAQPVMLNETTQIRGVDVCMLNIIPYQYNPVTKQLIVYRDIEVNIRFEGGSRQFGDTKYRNPYWDNILEDAIFNFQDLPVIDYASRVQDYSRSVGFEYLIITPNDPIFVQWADSIKQFRNEEGILTGVVKLSDIGSNVSATMLEQYVNNIYATWDIPPAAILLLGDFGQANANNNSITSPIYDNYCVSDNILADVNNDHMPDIVFARITAQNAAQLESMIGRGLKYERRPPTSPAFYQNPITALGWQTERWFQICSEVVGGFWKNVLGKTPVRINEIYQGTPGNSWSSAQNTTTVVNYFGPNGLSYIPQSPSTLGGWSGGNATMINNAMNAGSFMLMHRDHGMETGWGEPSYVNANINSLTNTDLTFILSINCLTGKYNWNNECFTEKFHRYTYNGVPAGALGLTAASETSYSFVNDVYVWGMMDNMWPNFMPAYGTTPASRGVLPAFGNAAGKYFLKQSSWPYNTSNKEVTYHLFHHHGDAFMRVCTEVPMNITATYPETIFESATEITITTAGSSNICVSAYGTIIGTASTGLNPTVTVTIPAQMVGTRLKVTITKPNCNRYEGYIMVVPDVTSAYAGEDVIVCSDQSVQMNGTAINYQTLLWQTAGTGTFDDATILNPVYTPGAEDLAAGAVVLSLTASKTGIPDSTDYVTVSLTPAPQIFAGNNAEVCDGQTYSTSEATASNYQELWWETSGTGVFSDDTMINTRYTPSAEDIANGNVVLTLWANNGVCDNTSSEFPLVINPNPVVKIDGALASCQNAEGVTYTAAGNTNTYLWEINGGTITSGADASQVTVTWTTPGNGYIELFETNEFGCTTQAIDTVDVMTAPAPLISGDVNVCANSDANVYSSPLSYSSAFEWTVTGGEIVSGAGTDIVTVKWGENGNGSLSVIETYTDSQCTGNAELQVAISSPVFSLGNDTTICVYNKVTIGTGTGFSSYSWSNGATTPSIEVTGESIGIGNQAGFTLTVTDAEGCTSEETILLSADACAGLPEGTLAGSISIYPNPNTGEFHVAFGETITGQATLKIFSASGKELYAKSVNVDNSQTEDINVTHLNRGVYFIKVETTKGAMVQKLVIK